MMLINHLVVSLTAWNVVTISDVFPFEFSVAPWTYALVALGTALPDIDHPHSTLGSKVKWLSWPIRVVFGHRNITHSLIAIIGVVLLAMKYPLMIPVAFGYVMHLVGDWLTVSGIKLFWPIRKSFKSPLTISTNSGAEYVIVWGISALLLTALHAPDELKHLITI